jgi:hypothetical protein
MSGFSRNKSVSGFPWNNSVSGFPWNNSVSEFPWNNLMSGDRYSATPDLRGVWVAGVDGNSATPDLRGEGRHQHHSGRIGSGRRSFFGSP